MLIATEQDCYGCARLERYVRAIALHWDSVVAIKRGLAEGDLASAAEAWFELTQDEQRALWMSSRDGSVWTTREREVMKSTAFRLAYFGSVEHE